MMRRDPFQAIADPNRRAILALIARETMNLNTVASHFSVSRPAISKHIKILRQCGLVEIRQKGRERYCEARLERLSEVVAWLEDYRSQWSTEIQTEPVSAIPAPQQESTPKPLAEVSVTKEEPITAAHVPVETIAAIEIGETLTEVMEAPESTVVDTIEVPQDTETQTTEADATTEPAPVRIASVPWEEGYIEEDESVKEAEIDLSAESITTTAEVIAYQETATIEAEPAIDKTVEPTSEITQPDEVAAIFHSEISDNESTRPVSLPPARKPAARKKKGAPPTDTLQGSLF